MRYSGVVVSAALILSACEKDPVTPELPSPRMAKAAPTGDVRSRVLMQFAESVSVGGLVVSAGIRGDGRNRFGQASAPYNEYQGDFCGVRGFIYDQRRESGALEVDPDTYYVSSMSPACGTARSMSFYLQGESALPTVAAPHILGTEIWSLTVGQSRLAAQRFGMQQTLACGELQFSSAFPGSSNIRVTRLADGVDANGTAVRRWTLESQGNHTAACVKLQSGGKFTDSGLRYHLPFNVTVTQVPYPSATYPD
jgi:hypothetical protein